MGFKGSGCQTLLSEKVYRPFVSPCTSACKLTTADSSFIQPRSLNLGKKVSVPEFVP